MLIRADAEIRHLQKAVDTVKEKQEDHEARTDKLTEHLQSLAFSVGGIVKSLEKVEALVSTQVEHQRVLDNLDTKLDDLVAWKKDHDERSASAIEKIYDRMAEDRKLWEPWVKLAGHWKWFAATVVMVVGVTGWPFIAKTLAFVAAL